VVEGGNGRVLALRRVYQANDERAERYREWLKSQGYDTADMKQPVLVRISAAKRVRDEAERAARQAGHEQVTVEHLPSMAGRRRIQEPA
jgi:hypothetical protein